MIALEAIFFVLFGSLVIICSGFVILLRNPLSSAFFLVLSFANLAGLFVLLEAHFIAAAQIFVYAGAIMVLFIFVIMLLNFGRERWGLLDHREPAQIVAVAITLATTVALILAVNRQPLTGGAPLPADFGQIAAVARLMFSRYLVAFELVSVLLLVAIIGAVLLAKRVI